MTAQEHAGDHQHDPFLAHHFDSHEQQFDAGKMGIWLFLVTEILFFSGLFVAYAIYRSNHPQVFVEAHHYLDKSLGMMNTLVLIFSSLTAAWAVRAAQTNQKRLLVICLAITLACASFFLGVKVVEYTHKWDLGLYWAGNFSPVAHEHASHGFSTAFLALCTPAALGLVVFGLWWAFSLAVKNKQNLQISGALTATSLAFFLGVAAGRVVPEVVAGVLGKAEQSTDGHGGELAAHDAAAEESHDGDADSESEHGEDADADAASAEPVIPEAEEDNRMLGVFFSIYYAMTGVHALHIMGGMLAITWLLIRAVRLQFNSTYFGPVDYVGLYWHLVDLIWIYLFPLLYLIH